MNRQLSVAPMMDWTDRHCRYFHRLLAPNALLYTEMVTTGAILHGDRDRLLRFDPAEHPVAVQLGGSDPAALADCAKVCEDWGYDEVNLNVGCPSDRVQSGRFGACLMKEPDLVADCLAAMRDAVNLPVTVKHRLGVDNQDEQADLQQFVERIASAGVTTFIVHARKAWLQGLSPKENRDVPPLNYQRVYQLKRNFPELEVIINGGIQTVAEIQQHLQQVDGVMLGRVAYQRPWTLVEAEAALSDAQSVLSPRRDYVEQLMPYVERELADGTALKHISRHLLGLFQGLPGARRWRRYLAQNAHLPEAGLDVLREALQQLEINYRAA